MEQGCLEDAISFEESKRNCAYFDQPRAPIRSPCGFTSLRRLLYFAITLAVDITLDLLKAAVIKLAELTGENRFILIGRATLAITAPAPFQEFARSDDIDLWPEGNEDAALDLCIQQMGEGSPFHIENGFYVERSLQFFLSFLTCQHRFFL